MINVQQVHFSRGQLDLTVGSGLRSWHLLAQVICHMSMSSITSSLSLSLSDEPIYYTSWHRWPLKGETGHRSLSLITLLPASSKDGVLNLLLSLLLCGLFAIGLLGVLGRGGFFLRKRRRGLPLIFNLRGGLGMPFFTGKY